MEKIRYKYRELKKGFCLEDVRCPTCGNKGVNWIKVVQNKNWNGKIILLAECWSGDTSEDKPKHLFLIEIDDLPMVQINKMKSSQIKRKEKK